jgi:hypothetical protein
MPMKKGADQAKASSKAFTSSRLQEQFFKDGDEIIVRFLTELTDWPVLESHIAVPTKPRPEKWTADNWPKAMSAVCANDRDAFALEIDDEGNVTKWEDGFGSCYIHANYTEDIDRYKHPRSESRSLTYALVVLREREGNRVKDKTEEYEVKDQPKKQVPAIRIIAQPWRTFYSQVHAGAFEDDSVCNRDFRIKKDDKAFTISPLSITANHHPAVKDHPTIGTAGATDSWKLYEETLTLIGADLEAWLRNRASEEWFKLWFWPGEWDAKKDGDTESDDAGSNVGGGSSASSELSPEDLEKFEKYKAKLEAQQGASG